MRLLARGVFSLWHIGWGGVGWSEVVVEGLDPDGNDALIGRGGTVGQDMT
jgi:hypothetical protein